MFERDSINIILFISTSYVYPLTRCLQGHIVGMAIGYCQSHGVVDTMKLEYDI